MENKNMKNTVIWLDSPLNDATAFYVDLLEQSMLMAGLPVKRVTSLTDARKADVALTLHAKATCQILLHNPRAKVITWFQGIVPEEAMLWQGKRLPNRVYKLAWELFELVALKMSSLSIFVSDAMHEHYQRKYFSKITRYHIIPCFNRPLKQSAFHYPGKYTTPSFVYAGGLDRWQCVDEMLSLFSKIQKRIPAASMTILSSQRDLAEKMLAQYQIKNGKVAYVPLADLDNELEKYKYGFLLRADHPINNVATPTKMNTYLSCGILPIYTSAVRDFEKKLGQLPYSIKAERPDDENVVQQVLADDDKHVDLATLVESYRAIFSSYYSAERYIAEVAPKMAQLAAR